MSDRWRFFFEALLANIEPSLAGGLASMGLRVGSYQEKQLQQPVKQREEVAGADYQVRQELSGGEMK